MNPSADELADLGRIIRATKYLRHLHPSPQLSMSSQANKAANLKPRLSAHDWHLWKPLQAEPEEVLTNSPPPELALPGQPFNLLLAQYRRAGLESVQACYQTKRQAAFGLDDPLPSN